MAVCLTPSESQGLLERIRSGNLNPAKLAEMSSADRRSYFEGFLGEKAQEVNKLFESKLILKDQQRGLVTWAKKVSGLTPEARRDIIARVERMTEILTPENERAFLEDLAAHKLGVGVTLDEAGKIVELSAKVTELEAQRGSSDRNKRMEYGRSLVDFHNYRNGLIAEARGETKTLREDWQQFKQNPLQKGLRTLGEVPGIARATKAAIDVSYVLRQGLKTMITQPRTWARNSVVALNAAQKELRGKSILDEVRADILSRKNADLYRQAKLEVGVREEEIPTTAPERLPVVGRAFAASNAAFEAQAHLTRADLFDFYYDRAREAGFDVTERDFLEGLGAFIGQQTGRARFPGQYEKAANFLNKTFFSPRFWASQVQTFTQPFTGAGAGRGSAFVRREAAKNLLRYIGFAALVGVIANAVNPDSYEEDPRSSNFGDIKVGDTRINTMGGVDALITLVARLSPILVGEKAKTKSATTGILRDLNAGDFGSQTGWDVLLEYMQNKLAPTAAVARDLLKGENFQGQPMTPANIAKGLFVPIPVENFFETLDNERSANLLLVMLMDGLGAGANTYSLEQNWERSTAQSLQQFREEVGNSAFKEANTDFNRRFNDWFTKLGDNEAYELLSEDEKADLLNRKRQQLRDEIFREYRFKPETRKKTPQQKKQEAELLR